VQLAFPFGASGGQPIGVARPGPSIRPGVLPIMNRWRCDKTSKRGWITLEGGVPGAHRRAGDGCFGGNLAKGDVRLARERDGWLGTGGRLGGSWERSHPGSRHRARALSTPRNPGAWRVYLLILTGSGDGIVVRFTGE